MLRKKLNKKEIHVLDRLCRVHKRGLPYLHIIHMIIKGIVSKVIERKSYFEGFILE